MLPPRRIQPYHWIDPRDVVATLSYDTLQVEIGISAAQSAVKLSRLAKQKVLIPNYEQLKLGDIILTSHPKTMGADRKWHPVSHSQRLNGLSEEHCHWTHAMLYVGELHIVESNKPTRIRTGVTLAPLTRDASKSEFIVLRYKGAEFAKRRNDIVRYALMSPFLAPRRYDLWGALSSHYRFRPRGADHSKRIFCSEFILECFAIGGAFMVELRERHRKSQSVFLAGSVSAG